MLSLPFVSRARFEDKCAELQRAQSELTELRAELKKLNNWTIWRVGGGVAPDASLLPEAYQPKAAAPAKSDGPTPINAVNPRQVRRDLANFEVKAQTEFNRAHSGKAPSKELTALVTALNEAAAEGQQAAAGD